MGRIEKIIESISFVYDIDRNLIINEEFKGRKNSGCIKTLCYFCYDAVLQKTTTMTLPDIATKINCDVHDIRESYEKVKRSRGHKYGSHWEIKAVEMLINK